MTGVLLGVSVLAGLATGPPAIVVAIVVGSLLWYGRQWSGRLWLIVTVATTVGVARGYEVEDRPTRLAIADIDAVRGTVDSVLATRGSSLSFVLNVDQFFAGERWNEDEIRLLVTSGLVPSVGRGDRVYLTGSFESAVDVDPGYQSYLSLLDTDGSGFARRVEIDRRGTGLWRRFDDAAARIRDQLQEAVPGDRGALLAGLITGDDARLSRTRRDQFVATGTTHLTAVSGANLALLLTVPAGIGRRSGLRRRLLWQAGLGVAIWLYALLVGLEPSVVRAAIVASIALFASTVGRRPDFVTLIVLAAAGQALVWPGSIDRLAFQLSVAASLALVLALQGRRPTGILGWLGHTLVSVCAAHVATVAILAPTFGAVSIMSIPANLLIAPIVSVSFAGAAISSISFLVSDPLGTAVASVAGVGAAYIIAIVDLFGGPVSATLPVGAVGSVGQVVLTIVSAGTVAAMSVECRQAVRRWWVWGINHQEAVWITTGAAVLGATLGVALEKWI